LRGKGLKIENIVIIKGNVCFHSAAMNKQKQQNKILQKYLIKDLAYLTNSYACKEITVHHAEKYSSMHKKMDYCCDMSNHVDICMKEYINGNRHVFKDYIIRKRPRITKFTKFPKIWYNKYEYVAKNENGAELIFIISSTCPPACQIEVLYQHKRFGKHTIFRPSGYSWESVLLKRISLLIY